jgi:hypothetical protein
MSSYALYRLSGAAMLLGSVLVGIANLIPTADSSDLAIRVTSATWLPTQVAGVSGALLMLLGLPGVYARQAARAGVLGLVSFVLAFISVALDLIGVFPMNAFLLPALATGPATQPLLAQPPSALGLYLFGLFLLLALAFTVFGVATIRAGVFPRPAGVLVVVGIIADLVGGFALHSPVSFGAALASVGFGWLGYVLLTRSATAEVAERRGIGAPQLA